MVNSDAMVERVDMASSMVSIVFIDSYSSVLTGSLKVRSLDIDFSFEGLEDLVLDVVSDRSSEVSDVVVPIIVLAMICLDGLVDAIVLVSNSSISLIKGEIRETIVFSIITVQDVLGGFVDLIISIG